MSSSAVSAQYPARANAATAPAVQAAAQAAGVAAAQTAVKLTRDKNLLDIFLEQVHTVAMCLLIVALVIAGLYFFAVMLQQLLIAVFLLYLILPIHNWLARFKLSAILTYSIMLVGILLIGWVLGSMVQQSILDFNAKWPNYERNIPATRPLAALLANVCPET
jgi:predicted PurR-regulated permease PerM